MAEGFWGKTRAALAKTRSSLSSGLSSLFSKKIKADNATLEDLEALLLGADMGVEVTARLISGLKEAIMHKEVEDLSGLKTHLQAQLIEILRPSPAPAPAPVPIPQVSLFVGVNGVGKTTSIGKRAAQLKARKKKVILAAADTFRAGAGGQLALWAARAGVELIGSQSGSDPSSVAFDAVSAALARKVDYLLIDTAGRLQTQHNLMEELKKMLRVIRKQIPEAPHEKILVLDASTGQNALSQARHFQDAVGLTSIILTKLDGSGRGGIVVPIVESMGIPVSHVGLGEGIDDLLPFHIESFVAALFEGNASAL